MSVINAEIYALCIIVILFIDYFLRFKHTFNKNSFLFLKFLFYIMILSILNIMITLSFDNDKIRFLLLTVAYTIAFLPPVILYEYIEENYLMSNYYFRFRKYIKFFYCITVAVVLIRVFSRTGIINDIPLYLTGSVYFDRVLAFSLLPIVASLIDFIYHLFINKRKISSRLLFVILLCIIGVVTELFIHNYSLYTLTYTICAILLYSYRHEIIIGHDNLTGLHNRDILDKFRNERRKSNLLTALYMLDVDKFKQINDTYGHDKGDEILKDISKILVDSVRIIDYVVRFGGDEFIIIARIYHKNDLGIIPEKIRENIERYNVSHPIKIDVSIGCGIIDVDKNGRYQLDKTMKKVDHKMYKEKALKKEVEKNEKHNSNGG